MTKKNISEINEDNKILNKIQHYCAYQERCVYEVKLKLLEYNLTQNKINDIIKLLKNDNFINEERFALAYVQGKFRIKKWGKNKIIAGLKQKKISDTIIQNVIKNIDDDEYIKTLKHLINNRIKDKKDLHDKIFLNKTINYLRTKGYEYHLIIDNIYNFGE